MTYQQAVAADLGREISWPAGQYAGECLSWGKDYINKTTGINPPPSGDGDAKGYFIDFPEPLGTVYNKITNNHSDPSQLPKQGDIIVWDGDVPGSDGAGHICVCNSAAESGFTSYDQNWGGNKTVHEVAHVWKGTGTVLGWLTPKSGSPAPAHDETVAKGTWYVRTGPSTTDGAMGVVTGGQVYATAVLVGGWRQISFAGRTGYVGPGAWSN